MNDYWLLLCSISYQNSDILDEPKQLYLCWKLLPHALRCQPGSCQPGSCRPGCTHRFGTVDTIIQNSGHPPGTGTGRDGTHPPSACLGHSDTGPAAVPEEGAPGVAHLFGRPGQLPRRPPELRGPSREPAPPAELQQPFSGRHPDSATAPQDVAGAEDPPDPETHHPPGRASARGAALPLALPPSKTCQGRLCPPSPATLPALTRCNFPKPPRRSQKYRPGRSRTTSGWRDRPAPHSLPAAAWRDGAERRGGRCHSPSRSSALSLRSRAATSSASPNCHLPPEPRGKERRGEEKLRQRWRLGGDWGGDYVAIAPAGRACAVRGGRAGRRRQLARGCALRSPPVATRGGFAKNSGWLGAARGEAGGGRAAALPAAAAGGRAGRASQRGQRREGSGQSPGAAVPGPPSDGWRRSPGLLHGTFPLVAPASPRGRAHTCPPCQPRDGAGAAGPQERSGTRVWDRTASTASRLSAAQGERRYRLWMRFWSPGLSQPGMIAGFSSAAFLSWSSYQSQHFLVSSTRGSPPFWMHSQSLVAIKSFQNSLFLNQLYTAYDTLVNEISLSHVYFWSKFLW